MQLSDVVEVHDTLLAKKLVSSAPQFAYHGNLYSHNRCSQWYIQKRRGNKLLECDLTVFGTGIGYLLLRDVAGKVPEGSFWYDRK